MASWKPGLGVLEARLGVLEAGLGILEAGLGVLEAGLGVFGRLGGRTEASWRPDSVLKASWGVLGSTSRVLESLFPSKGLKPQNHLLLNGISMILWSGT